MKVYVPNFGLRPKLGTYTFMTNQSKSACPHTLRIILANNLQFILRRRNGFSTARSKTQRPARISLNLLDGSTWMIGLEQGFTCLRIKSKNGKRGDESCGTPSRETGLPAPGDASGASFVRITMA